MSHSEKLIDSDKHFVINDITRKIKNQANAKEPLMQYDHNSERITFSIPRYIEGHDISECNKAEVHYINIDSKTKAVIKGRYDIMDFRIDETDETKMLCSWVISNNATKYVGRLNFLLRLSCVQENGTIDYAWNTKIYTSLMVSEGIYNTDDIKEEYADVLEQWKAEINTGLLNKVDKEAGKGLSTNDFTDELLWLLESAIQNEGNCVGMNFDNYLGNTAFVFFDKVNNRFDPAPKIFFSFYNEIIQSDPDGFDTSYGTVEQYILSIVEKTLKKRMFSYRSDAWSNWETIGYMSDENFTSELKNKLSNLYSNEEIDKKFENLTLPDVNMSGYAKKTELAEATEKLASKATFEEIEYEEVKGTLTTNTYVNANNGNLVEYSSYETREIEIEKGCSYVATASVKAAQFALAVFYDADYKFIGTYKKYVDSVVNYIREPIEIPENAVYMRVTTGSSSALPCKVPIIEKVKVSDSTQTIENLKENCKKADTLLWEKVNGEIEAGFVKSYDGKMNTSLDGYETMIVPLEEGYKYRVTSQVVNTGLCMAAFYAEDNKYNGYINEGVAGGIKYIKEEIENIPPGSAYMKVSTRPSNFPFVVEKAKIEPLSGLFEHTEKINTDLYNHLFLKGKTIVNFGDSIYGYHSNTKTDISSRISELTGATVYNCAFGGTQMSKHWNEYWSTFSMCSLVDAIVSNDFSVQDTAMADTNWTGRSVSHAYNFEVLKTIDFNKVDMITLGFGTNDFGDAMLDDEANPKNLETLCGALRYTIETLLTAYPHIQIFVCTPTYRFWMDDNGVFTDDSDTRVCGAGYTLMDVVDKEKEVSKEYRIKCIDNYFELGMNKFNRSHYFNANDGTHPNLNGRHLIASHIAKELF